MKSIYFDATYFGKLYWQELGSPEVLAFAENADEIFCSSHGRAEFCSIGFRKVREAKADSESLHAVIDQFNSDVATGFIKLLPITDSILNRVEKVFSSAPPTYYLRAADALHLASAAENHFSEIYSNDKHLLAAAPLFELHGINLLP